MGRKFRRGDFRAPAVGETGISPLRPIAESAEIREVCEKFKWNMFPARCILKVDE
ncbi:hypothetical protein B4135_2140 [Caldibacillus debilis]|uniref:Uncharacterized protein n=1 Tax=Caldibacillus debilis TaxID=301148 RepID=A0A150M4C0_9BACI|nr:hypothetical protein B4135_2140 [Caldibacillus debilis]